MRMVFQGSMNGFGGVTMAGLGNQEQLCKRAGSQGFLFFPASNTFV